MEPTEAQNLQQPQAEPVQQPAGTPPSENKPRFTKKKIIIAVGVVIVGILLIFTIVGSYWQSKNSDTSKETESSLNESNKTIQMTKEKQEAFEINYDDEGNVTVTIIDTGTKKILAQRYIDKDSLGWDIDILDTFLEAPSPEGISNEEFINETTIIIPVITAPGGIFGNKPDDALPDPPFNTAIYTTTFEEDASLRQVYSTNKFQSFNTLYYPDTNEVFITQIAYLEDDKEVEIIWSINIENGNTRKVANVILDSQEEVMIDYQELKLVNNKVHQLIIFTDQRGQFGSTENSKKAIIDPTTGEVIISDI